MSILPSGGVHRVAVPVNIEEYQPHPALEKAFEELAAAMTVALIDGVLPIPALSSLMAIANRWDQRAERAHAQLVEFLNAHPVGTRSDADLAQIGRMLAVGQGALLASIAAIAMADECAVINEIDLDNPDETPAPGAG